MVEVEPTERLAQVLEALEGIAAAVGRLGESGEQTAAAIQRALGYPWRPKDRGAGEH